MARMLSHGSSYQNSSSNLTSQISFTTKAKRNRTQLSSTNSNSSNSIMLSLLSTYKNLSLQIGLSLSITLIIYLLNLPIRFLEGLNTYIHPENIGGDNKSQSGFRPAIRRPTTTETNTSSNDSGIVEEQQQPRKRVRSKDKFEFDENNAQIFRLHLIEGHIRSRLYFEDYRDFFYLSVLACSSILLHKYLSVSDYGSLVPILLGFLALCKVLVALGKVSFERSSSKRSEKQLSVLFGGLGFVLAFSILFVVSPKVFDFKFGSIDGSVKIWIALLACTVSGFLFMPSTKSARSFWLGTDQLRWNLSIICCGWFARFLLYVNVIVGVFASLLWINPVSEILVNKRSGDSNGMNLSQGNERLVGNLGMVQSDFDKLRFWCLIVWGISQILALRPSLQMYLNEAVLCWYQRLHASKVPDLDFSRAKIFLHNYYPCLVVVQFLAPSALVLLFIGLSQIEGGNLFVTFPFLCDFMPCSAFVKEVALFMAWWVVFVSAIFTSFTLVLYRSGFLYVS